MSTTYFTSRSACGVWRHLHVGLLRVHQLLDDLAQPLRGAHVLVTGSVRGCLCTAVDPDPSPDQLLGVVHQSPVVGRARPLLEGLVVECAHCVHALRREEGWWGGGGVCLERSALLLENNCKLTYMFSGMHLKREIIYLPHHTGIPS